MSEQRSPITGKEIRNYTGHLLLNNSISTLVVRPGLSLGAGIYTSNEMSHLFPEQPQLFDLAEGAAVTVLALTLFGLLGSHFYRNSTRLHKHV